MRASEFVRVQPTQTLTIFDIDDTLLHTTAKIRVVRDGKTVKELTNQEFNNYTLQPGEEFDFGEFRDAEKFARESTPIKPMIRELKAILAYTRGRVIMLTARADFDDRDTFLDTFKRLGIDMSRVHVHRAGNLPGNENPAYKKAVWVRRYLDTGRYKQVSLYDDSRTNLRVFKELEQEYPQVKFNAYFIDPRGQATEVEEAQVNEKWTAKYKRSINCNNPKGFSQRAHCQGRKKKESIEETIRKQGSKYVIYSKDGSKKLGTYDSRKAAEKRLGQIEYFKHAGK